MLKTVSAVTNAIGALNYKGTWDASTNTPNLSTIGAQKGDYYVVSVAGSTSLGGITTWYVGDWAVYNGSAWQRVEGGADDPAPSLRSNSTTGLMQIIGPAAGTTRVITVPDANATMLVDGGALGTPASGTLTNCSFPTLNQNTTGSAGSVKSNATTGLMQITGPAAGQTRVVTIPDANATMARTDSGQTFTGNQQFNDAVLVGTNAATGSASNVQRITGGRFSTINGSGFTANNGVATTMFTLTNTSDSQTWLVCADLQGEGSTSYACVYVVTCINNSVTQAVPLVQGGLASISVSGLNVQYTQSSGGNKTNTQFSAIRIM